MAAASPGRGCRRQAGAARGRWMTAEAIAWLTAIVCLLAGGVRYVEGVTGSREAMARFAELQAAAQRYTGADFSLWSEARIKAWRQTSDLPRPVPLGVLRIPRIDLEVPILEGTDEVTLNQAVGHIEETSMPGAPGNSGIAGHRDGFFRGLKDLEPGDIVELETLRLKEWYRIEWISIVDPDDVSVLAATIDRSLTLVTCYPFYFVGAAPQRYIIRAVRSTALNHARRG
jgi:sortase A